MQYELQANLSNEWVAFEGTSDETENSFVLTTESGDSFKIDKEHVLLTDRSLLVRKYATIDIIQKSQDLVTGTCNCSNTIPSTDRNEKIQKFGCETTCFGVILICHYCNYGPGGVLTGESSSICGGCIGLPF